MSDTTEQPDNSTADDAYASPEAFLRMRQEKTQASKSSRPKVNIGAAPVIWVGLALLLIGYAWNFGIAAFVGLFLTVAGIGMQRNARKKKRKDYSPH